MTQLACALEDKEPPEWSRAKELLTTVICKTSEAGRSGFRDYEFSRAVCATGLESLGEKSTVEHTAAVVGDLTATGNASLFDEQMDALPDVQEWLELKGVLREELKTNDRS